MSNRNNRNRIACAGRCVEQLVLLALARDLQRQLPCPRPALTVKLAKMRDRFLPHLVAMTHRADKTPVGVRLAILADGRVPQVHRRAILQRPESHARSNLNNRVGWHYMPVPALVTSSQLTKPRIAATPVQVPPETGLKNTSTNAKLRKLG